MFETAREMWRDAPDAHLDLGTSTGTIPSEQSYAGVARAVAQSPVWTGIRDIPDDLIGYRVDDLENLLPVWREVRKDLGRTAALQEFHVRLARQWSIETGILERLYTVDRGTTQLLIEQGFDASLVAHGGTNVPPEQLVRYITAHRDALEGLFEFVRGERPLSTNYIQELHVVLTRAQEATEAIDPFGQLVDVPLLKGDWKQSANHPIRDDGTVFAYCPPEHVASEMDRLITLYAQHLADGVAPEVNAAWLHYRFTQIHPFQDGNGRLARALATIEFLRVDLFPLVVDGDQRTTYIGALEQADGGELRPLIDLFADIEKRALIRGLGLAQDAIQTAQNVETAVRAFAADLKQSFERPQESAQKALQVAHGLGALLVGRLETVRELLEAELRGSGIEVQVARSTPESAAWYRAQIIETAKAMDYYANLSGPRSWVRLHLTRIRADLVFSFHVLGYEPRGAMTCSAFTNIRLHKPAEDDPSWSSEPACDQPFVFSHATDPQQAADTFTRWIDHAVQVGLETIRRYRGSVED